MSRFVLALGLVALLCSSARADDPTESFRKQVMPVLEVHCTDCHGGKKPEGKLDLTGPRSLDQLRAESPRWFRILQRVEDGSMPPKDEKPLTKEERQTVASWIRGPLTQRLAELQLQEGRSKIRRLNRSEYANTIHDLFGIRPPVLRELPGDGRVDGYDKVSAALPFSSAGAAGYMKITEDLLGRMLADAASEAARADAAIVGRPERTVEGAHPGTARRHEGVVQHRHDVGSAATNSAAVPASARPGMHHLRISVYGYQTDKPLPFGIYAGHIWAYPQLVDLVGSPGGPAR